METRKLKMICTKSKLGHSLSKISELTWLTIDQVKQRLGQATGLTPKNVGIIFDMKQRGLSLEQISQETCVELEVLKQILPYRETVESQIDALAAQGKEPYEIGLDERAATLGSPDHRKIESRLSHTTTEESKQPPQPTQTLQKSQHITNFFYCCKTPLTSCVGLISSLENSPTILSLITVSRKAVVGVSYLEEVYSSLVDVLQ
jgi:hypothetical protein